MTSTKQLNAQELIDRCRRQESLESEVCRCCSELIVCGRALMIEQLFGQGNPDELAERIESATSKVMALESELQELAMLIDMAQNGTKRDNLALTEGLVQ